MHVGGKSLLSMLNSCPQRIKTLAVVIILDFLAADSQAFSTLTLLVGWQEKELAVKTE